MSNRRDFLKAGAAVAAGGLLTTGLSAPAEASSFGTYSRWKRSHGGPPSSPEYMGKLVPGFRKPGLPPVSVQTPDTEKLPWTMENGRKTFRLSCEVVKQEFLPGAWMNVWGFNGSMPGPVIEANQGDKVRIVVTNNLPEPTSMHWHGLELIADMDGVPGMTQDLIPPGGKYVYEFDLHQAGSFFYHSHLAMQEAMGMVGWLIIHPERAYTPTVDRDFALIFQNFFIEPSSMTADSRRMDWNWHTINGRSGPYTTPLLVKHGERVRVRLLDFSPMQHHPIHLHGHTYWLTGTEAGRIPESAWVPRNTTLVGVAMVNDFEFVANNPGDWIFHCHMVHHMMNHMTYPAGPAMRPGQTVEEYQASIPDSVDQDLVIETKESKDADNMPAHLTPGYPQKMPGGMDMPPEVMMKIMGRREVAGMRKGWQMAVKGLMTSIRVLPHDLYDRVVQGDPSIKPGEIFQETMRRVRAKG